MGTFRNWSLSITVSTTGFHPVNAGSTPAEITKHEKDPMGRFLCLIIFSREANLWVRSFKERVKKKNLFCFLIIDAERKCEALLPQRKYQG